MTSPAGPHRRPSDSAPVLPGPSGRAVLALLVAALAILATSPGPPILETYAVGEVVLLGPDPVERELRIHVTPEAGGARQGTIDLRVQAAHGLNDAWSQAVRLGLSTPDGPAEPAITGGSAVPVERCADGCDLAYRVVVSPSPGLLPGSVVRYEVVVRLEYESGSFGRDAGSLITVDLEGAATGPPAVAWSILAGLLAFVAGILGGPRVGRALGPGRRSSPAIALLVLALLCLARAQLDTLGLIVRPAIIGQFARGPLAAVAWLDAWSLALLLVLCWGLWHGIRRWPVDGGWSLALAAVAMVGLGGLWLVWAETSSPVIHPVGLAIILAVPAALGGIVVGQAWATDPSSARDRWCAAVGVVAHGILIAGFGFLAVQPFGDPVGPSAVGLLALLPAMLLALAFRRWLAGGRRWLILFDVLIAATGVLGLWLTRSLAAGISYGPERPTLDEAGVLIAVAASLVALVTAFHRLDRPVTGVAVPAAVDPPTP
jgi:hypothetical protein